MVWCLIVGTRGGDDGRFAVGGGGGGDSDDDDEDEDEDWSSFSDEEAEAAYDDAVRIVCCVLCGVLLKAGTCPFQITSFPYGKICVQQLVVHG